MDRTRYELTDDMVVDYRRAVFLKSSRTLVVADMHLGYVWAHRVAGQLMPVSAQEDTATRLEALATDYQPANVVLLGDVVHRVLPLKQIEDALNQVMEVCQKNCQLIFVCGNHDRQLCGTYPQLPAPVPYFEVPGYLLVHGDDKLTVELGERTLLMGHEHPAISLGDGISTSARCACFVEGERILILPAFSSWAAGSCIGRGPYMSPMARAAKFSRAIVIMGNRLLPMKL